MLIIFTCTSKYLWYLPTRKFNWKLDAVAITCCVALLVQIISNIFKRRTEVGRFIFTVEKARNGFRVLLGWDLCESKHQTAARGMRDRLSRFCFPKGHVYPDIKARLLLWRDENVLACNLDKVSRRAAPFSGPELLFRARIHIVLVTYPDCSQNVISNTQWNFTVYLTVSSVLNSGPN